MVLLIIGFVVGGFFGFSICAILCSIPNDENQVNKCSKKENEVNEHETNTK